MWKRPARGIVRLALRSRRLRAFIVAELAPAPTSPPGPPPLAAAVFVDRYGARHHLDPVLRDRLKPSWRTMVDPEEARRPPSDGSLAARANAALTSANEASNLVESLTGRPLDGRILEVGCYDGAVAYRLAARPGSSVVASDLARYYVIQRPGEPSEDDVAAKQRELEALRERTRHVAGGAPEIVEFIEDDITASALTSGTFDAIVSFEVLEHVRDPTAAFRAMHRMLKPGGIAYHDYNPFFSHIGGHSLCTLDFPWGHARLDRGDFERYLRERRPTEADQAMRFYDESLNRMTLAGLKTAVEAAGLELLALLPWLDRSLVPEATVEVLREVQRTHPDAAVEDLLASFVALIVRRPA